MGLFPKWVNRCTEREDDAVKTRPQKTSNPSLLGTVESCRAVRSIAAKEHGVCRQ